MDVLIKGLEMPKEGCSHTIYLYADGEVVTGGRVYKAVPVPTHGRLIDADALVAELERLYHGSDREILAINMVLDAPTIIEAEAME